jgi:hypothetical protein
LFGNHNFHFRKDSFHKDKTNDSNDFFLLFHFFQPILKNQLLSNVIFSQKEESINVNPTTSLSQSAPRGFGNTEVIEIFQNILLSFYKSIFYI